MQSAMRTAICLLLVVLLSGSWLEDCSGFGRNDPPPIREFHLGVTPVGGGSISVDGERVGDPTGQPGQCAAADCTFQGFDQARFSLVATPAPGFHFVRWQREATDRRCALSATLSASATLLVSDDNRVSCVAEFAADGDTVQLTVNVTQAGTVTTVPALINECAASCSAQFPVGQPIRLIPVAHDGSHFVSWTGDCANHLDEAQEVLLTPTAAATCGANFAPGPGMRPDVEARTEEGMLRDPPAVLVHSSFWVVARVLNPEPGVTYSYDWEPVPTDVCSVWVRDDARSTFDADWRQCVIERDADFQVTVRASDGQEQILRLRVRAQSGARRTLTVRYQNGTPDRNVVSTPGGINCGAFANSVCTADFDDNTTVTLLATPADVEWLGCTGTAPGGVCQVLMNQSRDVVATFAPPAS